MSRHSNISATLGNYETAKSWDGSLLHLEEPTLVTDVIGLFLLSSLDPKLNSSLYPHPSQAAPEPPLPMPSTHAEATPSLDISSAQGDKAPESAAVPSPVTSHRHSSGSQGPRKFFYCGLAHIRASKSVRLPLLNAGATETLLTQPWATLWGAEATS